MELDAELASKVRSDLIDSLVEDKDLLDRTGESSTEDVYSAIDDVLPDIVVDAIDTSTLLDALQENFEACHINEALALDILEGVKHAEQ